jgi:hypothetical protein
VQASIRDIAAISDPDYLAGFDRKAFLRLIVRRTQGAALASSLRYPYFHLNPVIGGDPLGS